MDLHDGVLAELIVDGLGHGSHHLAVPGQGHGVAVGVRGGGELGVGRGGQVVDDVVEQGEHARVVEGGGADHGGHGAFLDALAEAEQDVLLGQLHLLEVLLHELLVRLGSGLGELLIEGLGFVAQVPGDGHFLQVLAVEQVRGHVDDVHETLEVGAFHDGQLDGDHVGAELLVDHGHDLLEGGVLTVHLVDDHHAGHALGLAHGHGLLGAHHGAGDRAHHDQGAVGQERGGGHVAIEVVAARGVDKVDLGVLPLHGLHGHVDGAAALGFFGIEVGDGGAVLHLADTIDEARVKQNGLYESGLSFAGMAENAHVANGFSGIVLHPVSPYRFVSLMYILCGEGLLHANTHFS